MENLFLFAPLALLVACDMAAIPSPSPPSGPALPPLAQDTCKANDYANLIGQDATALERVLILDQVRVIRPGDAVTMDYRAERINFNVSAGNRITSISCS